MVWLVYEQLFTSPRDDPLSSYPLIAESAKIADDKSFIIFHLNPMARWQDGLQMRLKGIENDRYLNDYGILLDQLVDIVNPKTDQFRTSDEIKAGP
jgi:ABC-type transport system substrate-binding protein